MAQKEVRVTPEARKSKSSSMLTLNSGSRSTKFLSEVGTNASAIALFSSHSSSFGERIV